MEGEMPVVLIASVSPRDGQNLELSLKKTGWNLLRVGDAEEVAQHLDGADRPAVLVIDSGLLEMSHDAQWRTLRALRPGLGAVVRCLVPQPGGRPGRDAGTFLVHPDDLEGIRDAVRSLAGSGSCSARSRSGARDPTPVR